MSVRRSLLAIAVVLLAAAITAGAYSLVGNFASSKSDTVQSYLLNRVNFTADNTVFHFDYKPENDTCTADILLTASKTEADFYACIDSISLTGADFVSFTMIPAQDSASQEYPEALVLGEEDGKPLEYICELYITFVPAANRTLEYEIEIQYTSGINYGAAQKHLLKIPVTVSVPGESASTGT